MSVNSFGEQSNGHIYFTSLSADGRFVSFGSDATNLVEGDTNNHRDMFVHDRGTGETTRVNVNGLGEQANAASEDPSLSADGRFVTFDSLATNLVDGDTNDRFDVFVHDRTTGETTRVSVNSLGEQLNGNSFSQSFNADGTLLLG